MPFSVVGQFFKNSKHACLFSTKLIRVGAGSYFGLKLGLVSSVFSAFFEIFHLQTLETHADHNQLPD